MSTRTADVGSLLGRKPGDIQAMILAALDGDTFEQAEVDAIADMVRDRAVANLGETLRVEIAAALIAGAAPLAIVVGEIDAAVEVVHDWLVGHTHASILAAADEIDALLDERAIARTAHGAHRITTCELVAVGACYAARYEALGLRLNIGQVELVALPCDGGVCVMTVNDGRTLSHVDFRGDDGDSDGVETPTPMLVA